MSDEDLVTIERDAGGAEGVAHVLLNRPQRMNALDGAVFDAIVRTIEQLHTMPGLRAIVLSGQGRAFCAGLDLKNFERMVSGESKVDLGARSGGAASRLAGRTHGSSNVPQHAVLGWRELPVPVIAAIHGVCFGGGLQIALGADIRIAAPDARLAVLELAWGLVPDMGGMVLMRELLRGDVMRDLVLTAREVDGGQAQAIGLVTRLAADPLAEALALARHIASLSPQAVRAAKRLLNRSSGGSDEASLLLAESHEQQALIGSEDQVEAVQARLAKRAARFRGA